MPPVCLVAVSSAVTRQPLSFGLMAVTPPEQGSTSSGQTCSLNRTANRLTFSAPSQPTANDASSAAECMPWENTDGYPAARASVSAEGIGLKPADARASGTNILVDT